MSTHQARVREFLRDPANAGVGGREAARRLGIAESTFRTAEKAITKEAATEGSDDVSKAITRDVVKLSDEEASVLAECESVIEAGMQTFYEVGTALLTIRNDRLYRASHKNFEVYCRERWGFSDARANQLVDAAKVVENLKDTTMVVSLESERQARPLIRLEPEQQQEAWQKAVESSLDGKPTAKQVAAAAEEVAPKPKAPAVNGQSRVNGHVVPDPPDVAKARAEGRIAPGVVPEVDEPGESTSVDDVREEIEERKAKTETDLSDEDWLATLPLHSKLTGSQLKTFGDDALCFRDLGIPRATYKWHVDRLRGRRRNGAFMAKVRSFLAINGPDKWVLCTAPENGGCGGTGASPITGECPKCYGRGYRING